MASPGIPFWQWAQARPCQQAPEMSSTQRHRAEPLSLSLGHGPACRKLCCSNCWLCPGCFLQAGPTPHCAGPMGSAGLRAGSAGSQLLSLSQGALTCSQVTALWPHPFKNPLWGVHSHCVGLAWKICIASRNIGSGDMGQGKQSQLSPASWVSHCCALYTSAERT